MEIPFLQTYMPIFAIIVFGFILRRAGFPKESFWPVAEQITYYILFPCLLVVKIATTTADMGDLAPMVAALLCAFGTMGLVLVSGRKWLSRSGPAFTSLFQGTVRFNTYIGLTIILFGVGEQGVVVAAVVMAILIPLVNIFCVAVLVRYGKKKAGDSWLKMFSSIVKNPVVIACLVGIMLHAGQVTIIAPVGNVMVLLGKASLPLGLLTVGGGLDFTVFGAERKTIFAACLLKLIVLPLCMLFYCHLFAVAGLPRTIVLLFAALPGSALSFILARQLGGDSRLMAAIVSAQTCLAVITMPGMLLL